MNRVRAKSIDSNKYYEINGSHIPFITLCLLLHDLVKFIGTNSWQLLVSHRSSSRGALPL
jgi:hypothetical protein